MYVTSSGAEVGDLTDNLDRTMTLRLAPDAATRAAREIRLREPTARQYALLRVRMTAADDLLREKCGERPAVTLPDTPSVPEPGPDADAGEHAEAVATRTLAMADQLRVLEAAQREINDWSKARATFVYDPEEPPYALCVIEAVKLLGGCEVTLDDLTVETFDPKLCKALLEAWETPLGGTASLRQMPVENPTVPSGDGSVPASPESSPSSPPGTGPSGPPPPES